MARPWTTEVPTPALATLPQLDPSARAGESLIFLNDRGTAFDDPNNSLVVINQANNQEIRRIGELRQVTLTTPSQEAYPTNTLVEGVTRWRDNHIAMNAASAGEGTTDHPIFLTQETQTYAAELSVGQTLILGMDPKKPWSSPLLPRRRAQLSYRRLWHSTRVTAISSSPSAP